jgi:hypothetical protein
MRKPFGLLFCTLLCLGMAQGAWADDLTGDGLYSRDLLFETLQSSLYIERDPEFTEEEVQKLNDLFHDFAANSELSDEEVFALNRSLNNARHTPWRIDFTTEENLTLLEELIEHNYDSRQINSLTKALESEAKFLSHYERTGKDFFLLKAETEKRKFLSRIDGFDDTGLHDSTSLSKDSNRAAILEARQEARSALKDVARQARLQAKTLARETTRLNARGSSRNSAKLLAQETRRELKASGAPSKGNQGKNK